MSPLFERRRAGLAMIAFALAVNIPYGYLVANFGYDDILREPPATVLKAFAAGGDALVWAWFAFALCAFAMVFVAGFLARAAAASNAPLAAYITAAGIASAIVQAIGLSRWTFVVPHLAKLAASADHATQQAALVSYDVLHQFAGVAIGEHVGQTLLAIWTGGVSLAILRGNLAPRLLGIIGLVITPLWLIGQTELLATVVRVTVIEVTPIAFIAWQLWLLAFGIALLFRPRAATAAA